MLSDLESVEKVLPAENAATGGWGMGGFQGNPSDMAKENRRGRGNLCMIFRLGKHPRCEFANGHFPAGSGAVLNDNKRCRMI
ncbi:uncharacterized protein LOC128264905 [Drosophila gunungcola]|uniref:Uncharacterized protein n=1 Tax=Drosophila gunungcola TaxID=103775 RepID=A0A9P9YCK5_9MUSC|nr:uncharacterized protein LOC128264905 [Drosophila gunungcola]XP_052856578.1 uncharacterized protein LOC128264905 [Drosophila gunungcola]KAI8034058.1 hypothetical protein M5D96_013218 [Drosophila gunungcola]